jgi:hypothetical protein
MYQIYGIYEQQIAECDTALGPIYKPSTPGWNPEADRQGQQEGRGQCRTSLELRGELYRISGTDPTQIIVPLLAGT